MPSTHALRSLAIVAGLALAQAGAAQEHKVRASYDEEFETQAGHGEVSLILQYVRVDGFQGSLGNVPVGEVHTQVIGIEASYALTDRLTIFGGIPFVRERYLGPFDHDPLALDPPRTDVPNVDLGDWNTDFQDFFLGLGYRLKDAPLIIEPFIVAGTPSNNYPFFGHAAIGRNLSHLEVGSTFVFRPLFSDAWYRLDLSYVFMEQTLGVSVNHVNANAEAGYFFSTRLAGRLFIMHRVGDGLDFPTDFPPPAERTDEMWYQHDRLVKHNFTNAGFGFDWRFNDRYSASLSALTMLDATQIHDVEYAINVAITRSF
jgi:hypothetical protein